MITCVTHHISNLPQTIFINQLLFIVNYFLQQTNTILMFYLNNNNEVLALLKKIKQKTRPPH